MLAPRSDAPPAIDRLARQIAAGRMLTTRLLAQVMDDACQATAASGAWSWRDAYDLLEAGLLTALPGLLDGKENDAAKLAALMSATARLPTHTRRSETQRRLQQFSTPAPYSFVASSAAGLRTDDIVLEPSAGVGALAAFAQAAGARLILNELDPKRRALLSQVLATEVHGHDAELIDDLLPASLQPSVVLMNPPFSSSAGRSDDPDIAAKHLVSALKRLLPGGRLVAIMPPRFAPDRPTWWAHVTERWAMRLRLEVGGRVYRKHGTRTDTVLVVIDKVESCDVPVLARIDDLADALPILAELPVRAKPERHPRCDRRSVPLPQPRKVPARRPALEAAPIAAAPAPIAFQVLDRPRLAEAVSEIYARHVTQRIAIEGAKPHPTPLVESLAMASVAPPAPAYHPTLPTVLIGSGALSAAQLETVIYAGDAHSRHLPGDWMPNDSGDALLPAREGEGLSYRFGFFLGDGTGCGKGRQVAAIILDNFLAGRRRALWISKTDTLLEDAIRDWTAVGGAPTDIRSLRRWKPDEAVTLASSILFTTYATLRASSQDGATRLDQVLDWLGPDFEGVIAFDEAHAMGNAAGAEAARGKRKPSLQGMAGLRLQNRLPNARMLYVSATGASTVESLAYATRLGLWDGPDAPFPNRAAFTAAMAAGGVAAMEVVARDLKALGLYTARSLAFDGVEYDIVEHRLIPAQRRIYDAYADAFQIIHQNLTAALQATNVLDRDGGVNNGAAKSAAFSRFESLKQRFFNHLITGMKMPTVIAAIRRDLDAGMSAVVQLVSTGEAMLDRRLATLAPEDLADLHLDLTPREYVMTYLLDAFPVTLHRVIETEDGGITTEIVTDDDGRPVPSREALAARDALIERLALLAPVPTALDQLIWAFGPDAVAEVTGRTKRAVYRGEGELRRLVVEPRSAAANAAETAAFQAGEKRILVFSDAGGTGRSYHADLDAPNRERRHHYLVEPGWRADAAIQGLGRSHRSNQASAPLFRLVASDVAGEKRFTSTIARRLDALGALTKGQRQTGGQGMFRADDNLESPLARQALRGFYRAIVCGRAGSIDLARFEELTALRLTDEVGVLLDDLPPMPRLLNRLLAVDLERQAGMFEELFGFIEARIEAARQAGTLDVGVEVIRADSLRLLDRDVLRTCPRTGAETILSTIERRQQTERRSAADLLASVREGQPLLNPRSGKTALRAPGRSCLTEDGDLIRQFRLIRPRSTRVVSETDLAASAWEEIDCDRFIALWDAEIAVLPEVTVDKIHVMSGLLLPVWKRLPVDNQRVYRLELDDGTPILGRLFDHEEAGIVRARLKPTEVIDAASLLDAVLCEGRRIALAEGAMLARRSIAGEPRLEIEQAPACLVGSLKAKGCFTEMIDWQLRVFVPLHDDRTRTLPLLEAATAILPPQ